MKKIIAFVLLLVISNSSFSQEVNSTNFEVGVNYVVAKTSSLGQGSNSGIGIFVGHSKEISGKSKLIWTNRLGVSYSSECQEAFNCNSWWYSKNLWLSSTLSKTTKIGQKGVLRYGLGYVLFYGPRITGSVTRIENGVIVSQTFRSKDYAAHGPMLDLNYSNRSISENVSLNYTFASDLLDKFRTGIHSFGLVYRIPRRNNAN